MSSPELPPSVPSAAPLERRNTIFRGPNGIRAGWRALIFLAIVAAISLILFIGIFIGSRGRIQGGLSQLTPSGIGISEGMIFFVFLMSAFFMSLLEKRPLGHYGLPASSAFRKNFWVGTFAGFLAISGCLLGIAIFHGFHLAGLAIRGSTIVWATFGWSLAFIMVGLAEEFAFRGYLQTTLSSGIGFWPSAILLSALFGLAHAGNPGESRSGLLSVVFFGLLFCFFLRRTGNLWWPVGFHAGWDWGQTFFYGVPDSGVTPYHNLLNSFFTGPAWLTGGTVGPEASIFTPVVLAIAAFFFSRCYRENRYQVEGAVVRPKSAAYTAF